MLRTTSSPPPPGPNFYQTIWLARMGGGGVGRSKSMHQQATTYTYLESPLQLLHKCLLKQPETTFSTNKETKVLLSRKNDNT